MAVIQRKTMEYLEERIDPDYGLLDNLLAAGILNRRETLEIKNESIIFKRNQSLLKKIKAKHAVQGLITELKKTNQAHLSNFLSNNGGTLYFKICLNVSNAFMPFTFAYFNLESEMSMPE